MLLTLAMADTRSLILVVFTVLSRVKVLWTSARKRTLFHSVLVQRVLTFSLSSGSGVFPLVIVVCGKKLYFKDNPCRNLLSCLAEYDP